MQKNDKNFYQKEESCFQPLQKSQKGNRKFLQKNSVTYSELKPFLPLKHFTEIFILNM